MDKEILNEIKTRGLLLEKEIFDLVGNFDDPKAAVEFLRTIEKLSGQKIITRSVLTKNINFVKSIVDNLPGENKLRVENTFVRLGVSLEIKRESAVIEEHNGAEEVSRKEEFDYEVISPITSNTKKLEVADFTSNFRARYQEIQRMLMYRPELGNLIGINKISNDRTNFSIIGLVNEKRITKNKNMIIKFEDLTGEISALVKFDREELFQKAEELLLDDVVAIKASGNRDIIFVHDIIFPDAAIPEKIKFEKDISIAFVSDVHVGNVKHLEKSFLSFLEWLNSDNEDAQKVKYIFFVGDNVDGVGVFPGQEAVLNINNLNGQYAVLAEYLRKVPKRIMMFMCPGQHDASRVAQPQPPIHKNYAPELYDIENLMLVSNPTMVKLKDLKKEFKVLMYHGASIHTFIHDIRELRELKAAKTPAKVIKHMLKRRHLDPIHSDAIYIPNAEKDPLVITEVPDLFCTGEMHRVDVETYNGILIITGSCWQGQTPHEEKIGSIPDPCKVPVFNLKTRELKIFDFGVGEEIKELHTK